MIYTLLSGLFHKKMCFVAQYVAKHY